ncbi:hypothetical protein P4S65_10760 [Pseudoalteromonas sp. B131b]|uniref:AbiJ-NTD4 domain-containing protein n=1 Tax=Pseudoalteromonas sp. B131b TaxID=630493 RepID=UPI00301DBA68
MKFSHRFGFDPEYKNEPISEEAPNWLKSLFFINVLEPLLYIDGDSRQKNEESKPLGVKDLIERLCAENGHETDSEDFDSWTCWDALKSRLMNLEWYQFYDFVEITAIKIKEQEIEYSSAWENSRFESFMFPSYRQKVNDLFSQHKIQWKLNDAGKLETPLPKDLETRVSAIDSTLQDKFEPARVHYSKARSYILSPSKDPENSIKESVSAVESVCKTIYPKCSTLGDALKAMKREQLISPMLVTVFEKFYAYTNAEPAVRHGSNKISGVGEMDAELALHMSAAFIRTIISRKS